MKKTFQIIALILLAFLLPMLTSLLLDWQWIDKSLPRKILVILFMVLQMAICIMILRKMLNKK